MIQGTLDRLHFGDLLHWLQMGGISGRLTLHDDRGDRRLDFLEGRVVYASSTVPGERFASWLASRNVLPAIEVRRLLAIAMLRRSLFTDLLITEGGLTSEGLKRSLTDLAETITSRILFSAEVRFEFDPAYPVRDLLALNIDVEPSHLLMEAARRSDEDRQPARREASLELPFVGQAFEEFFWTLIQEGIPSNEPVDGSSLVRLHRLVRDIVGTLAQWLASSPGLVPMPSNQTARIAGDLGGDREISLFGLPHATWNQMVLACSVRGPDRHRPLMLGKLERAAAALDLWLDLTSSEFWHRPETKKLDELTVRVAADWSRRAKAAAPHLGVDPETASLAAHLITVPTDLVLWVLATLPVPNRSLRQVLLQQLPQRVGSALAHIADFPAAFAYLFEPKTPTPLGLCLSLAREGLPSAVVWPQTMPTDDESVLEIASPSALAMASDAVREVIEEGSGEHAAVG